MDEYALLKKLEKTYKRHTCYMYAGCFFLGGNLINVIVNTFVLPINIFWIIAGLGSIAFCIPSIFINNAMRKKAATALDVLRTCILERDRAKILNTILKTPLEHKKSAWLN